MSGSKGSNEAWSGMGTGWAVTATLAAGMVVCGGIGYLVGLLVGASRVFVGIGIVLGAAAGIYVVYLRFGREGRGEG